MLIGLDRLGTAPAPKAFETELSSPENMDEMDLVFVVLPHSPSNVEPHLIADRLASLPPHMTSTSF